MYQPMSLLQFQQRFQSDADCAQYLFEKRWPDGFRCPCCECAEAYFLSKSRRYQCKHCRYQSSLTAGTIFHRTRTPLRYWFWMIFLMSRNKAGFSMLGMQKLLGMKSYRRFGRWGRRFAKPWRIAMIVISWRDWWRWIAFFGGKREEIRGRGAEDKAKVLVAAENRGDKAGFASMDVVDRIGEEAVRALARKRIRVGQTIKPDGYSSFKTLTKDGYQHERVLIGTPEQASEKFPWVHTVISNVKSALQGVHHGVSLKHLQRYLSEYSYRFNRRYWEEELFDRLLTACSASKPVACAELM